LRDLTRDLIKQASFACSQKRPAIALGLWQLEFITIDQAEVERDVAALTYGKVPEAVR
jgi:hypothetical protein